VKHVVEFRDHAAECRALAIKQHDPKIKRMILDLADQWEALARARETILVSAAEAEARRKH
jgi:hypothetical protein